MTQSSEELIPLAKVAKFLPPELGRVHSSTAARWALRGIGNPRVKLETVKIGGRRYVTCAAVERFISQLSHRENAKVADVITTSRKMQMDEANVMLHAAGV